MERKANNTLTAAVKVTKFEISRESGFEVESSEICADPCCRFIQVVRSFVSKSNKYVLCSEDLCCISRNIEANTN